MHLHVDRQVASGAVAVGHPSGYYDVAIPLLDHVHDRVLEPRLNHDFVVEAAGRLIEEAIAVLLEHGVEG